MSKFDECLKCGSHDFVNVNGAKVCENCGMEYSENETNNSSKMINKEFNDLWNPIIIKKTLIVLIPLIILIFVVGYCESTNIKASDLPNYGINITNVTMEVYDYKPSSSSGTYSNGSLKFEILTKGTIHANITVELFNGNKMICVYSCHRDIVKFSHMNLKMGNIYTDFSNDDNLDIRLPRDNTTITDVKIVLKTNDKISVEENKIFETPKINVGNLMVRYNG